MIEATLQIAHAGSGTASIRLDKVNAEGVALALATPLNWLMVLPAVELVEGRFSYEDQGLVDRLLVDQARAQGRRPEEMRRAILADLHRRAQADTDPAVRSVWQSTAAYVRNPGRVQIGARPPRPTTLGQLLWMRQPRDIIRGLGIDIATNP
jgi:hypothetical protein